MNNSSPCSAVLRGDTILGIELGSTRIKSVLISSDHIPLASGSFTWENQLVGDLWTYSLEDALEGLRRSYRSLAEDVMHRYGVPLQTVGAIGISGMMHGYLAVDKHGKQLSPFLTWRNTNTAPAAAELTELFGFNIPLRWSIAQLYQAILDQKPHVAQIAALHTLSSYIHWRLTDRRVIGIGEAAGMFPIDSALNDYDQEMVKKFRAHIAGRNYSWDIAQILPQVLTAGQNAGSLTKEGAALLDPSGQLQAGIPLAPPEGDAGTGMAATNSVAARTGNVSAGTSIFSMVVLERQLSRVYPEIDMVTTPSGRPVAMVHCNNCTTDMNAWTALLREFSQLIGRDLSEDELFPLLYRKSLEGAPDCGGVLVYNYQSGEPITGFTEGRPIVVRAPGARFSLANFLRAQLYSTLATLVIGMETLSREQVIIDRLTGHGGLFKTPGVGQKYLAAATKAPVIVMNTAGEGGPYGMALLAAYMKYCRPGETLESYLDHRVFEQAESHTLLPEKEDVAGFEAFLAAYRRGLPVEQASVEYLSFH